MAGLDHESAVASALNEARGAGADNDGASGAGAGDVSGGQFDAGAADAGDAGGSGAESGLPGVGAAGTTGAAALMAPGAAGGAGGYSREYIESLERDARLGREFAPYADSIRDTFQRTLAGGRGASGPAGGAGAAAPAPTYDRDYSTIFQSPQGWNDYWTKMRADPATHERAILAVFGKHFGNDLAASRKEREEFAKYREATEKELASLRGFARLADHRFSESDKWRRHGKTVEKWFEEGRFNASHPEAIDYAFDLAQKLAKQTGASAAQAAAAGNQAAQAVAAGANPAGAAKAAAAGAKGAGRPAPVDEPSLRGGKGAARGTTTEEVESARTKRLRDPQYHAKEVEAALRKAKTVLAG